MADDKRNVFQRLNAVRSKLGYVRKNQTKIDGKYTAVRYDDIVEAVHDLLVEHGVMVVTNVRSDWTVIDGLKTGGGKDLSRFQGIFETTFYNVDDPTDCFISSCPAFGLDSGDKGPGKAQTYGTKANLLKTLFLVTGDQEEERVESEPEPQKPQAALTKEEADAFIEQATLAGTKKELEGIYQACLKVVKSRKGKAADMIAVTEACSKRAGVLAEAAKKQEVKS